MEDEAIVGLFFDRSEEAIERLNEKYGRVILSIGKNILGNEPDAEECANDAYLAVWNSIPPERPLCLSAYVCKIARNIALKRYRYRKAEKRSARFDVSLEELEGILQDTEGVESPNMFWTTCGLYMDKIGLSNSFPDHVTVEIEQIGSNYAFKTPVGNDYYYVNAWTYSVELDEYDNSSLWRLCKKSDYADLRFCVIQISA